MRLARFIWRYRLLWAILAIAIGLSFSLVSLVAVGGILLVFLFVMMGIESVRQWIAGIIAMRKFSEEVRRTLQGRCVACGYDIRASKTRCPECGTDIPPPPLSSSPMAKRVLSDATAVSREMADNYVGTEHLLLALFHQPEGQAAQILYKLGVTEDDVRALLQEPVEPLDVNPVDQVADRAP
jgi:hypothetical protein